jgi:tetratricopeptide (TPR) repeat protein
MARREAGDEGGAVKSLLNAISICPEHARAHYELGLILARRGAFEDSVRHLERALVLDQYIESGWLNLGNVHYLRGDLGRARAAFRAALAAHPDSVAALSNMGLVLKEQGEFDQALAHLWRAHQLDPLAESPLRNLMLTLVDSNRLGEAVTLGERIVAGDPERYEAQLFMGIALERLNEPGRALPCLEAAVRLRPEQAEAHRNRGKALQGLGRLDEAVASYSRALELQPDLVEARLDRALARLSLRQFEKGWEDYEARRASEDFPRRDTAFPEWDGDSLDGRSVFVYSEQGIGDEIMFASCFPALARVAGECAVECEARLAGLFKRSFPGMTFLPAAPDRAVAPELARRGFEVEIPIGSLPRALGIKPQAAQAARYLTPDPVRVARWKQRLATAGPGMQVGISWAGGVDKTRRSLRSIPLEQWLPILRTPDVSFVSLQYTPGAGSEAQSLAAAHKIRLHHWQDAIDDLDETAGLVAALDLVISVCTAVVHLGGALGQRVWVMTPCVPEWRYGVAGEDMPWYPSVRLVRQSAPRDWSPVVRTVAGDLQVLAGGKGASPCAIVSNTSAAPDSALS